MRNDPPITAGAGAAASRRAAARVWSLILAVIGTAVMLWAAGGGGNSPLVAGSGVPWWAVGLAFYLAEANVVDLHLRGTRHTIALSEIALVVGLYVLSPGDLLLAQFVGVVAALGLIRRERTAKLVLGAAQSTLTTMVALIVFRAIVHGSPLGAAGWVGAVLAALAAALAGIAVVTIAIALVEGRPRRRELLVTTAISVVATAVTANVALIGIELTRQDPRALALLAIPAAVAALALRGFVGQSRQHEHLEYLYQSMRSTQGAPEFSLAVGRLLITVRKLVHAEYAEILLFPTGEDRGLRSTLGAHGDMTAHPEELGPADARVVAALRAAGEAILLPKARPVGPLDEYLAARGLPDGVVAALGGEDGPFGLLVVGDRPGDTDSFTPDDKRLLEAFAAHAGVLLENGRLGRSVAALTGLKDQLGHQALHDILTGLPNRALLTQRVGAAIASGASTTTAVLFLDLDDFKTVNDTFGHSAGDDVLVEVASRIRGAIRAGDTAARLGGDEFAVLLEGTDERGAEIVAASLVETMKRPFVLDGRPTNVPASVGIAFAGSAGSADELLDNADVAMYAAKSAGKHRFTHFAPEMHVHARSRQEFVRELQGAVERDEISLVFEPIVDLREGRIVHLEALARWNSVERGVVSPGDFIPVAEDLHLIVPIGRTVLRQACKAARSWQQDIPGASGVGVTVNVSPDELADDRFVSGVAQTLRETGLPARCLMLEITESAAMVDVELAQRRMHDLRALGVRLALDDFGTGRSSLERLDSFPLDAVKIAKPFVDKLLDERSESSFIDAFVRLGYSLDLECIAEGIEHRAQVPRLLDRGCALGQGFFFAAPLSGDDVPGFLARHAGGRHGGPLDLLRAPR